MSLLWEILWNLLVVLAGFALFGLFMAIDLHFRYPGWKRPKPTPSGESDAT